MKTNKKIIALLLLGLTGCGCRTQFPAEHGIVNFDFVDGRVWRGAQPTRAGLAWLAEHGARTVVNLREAGDGLVEEGRTSSDVGLLYTNLPMSGTSAPTRAQVEAALAVLESWPAPVFVHCQHGSDRTGTVIACYRMRHGWSAEEALREARLYGMSPFEWGMRNFVRGFK